jgi:ribosomal protein L29
MKNAMAEVKKLDPQAAVQKVAELRKAMFDNKQKLIRGEFKDTNFFKNTRREIARLLSVAGKNVVVAVPKTTAVKTEKVEKAEKVTKPKKAKVAKTETAEAAVEAPKKVRKTKAKKEEQ